MGHRLPDSPRVREMNRHAFRHARRLGANYLGTEHQLLGIVSEGGLAAQVLAEAGADEARIQPEVGRTPPDRVATPSMDDDEALGSIGVDVAEVRARVRESFGTTRVETAPMLASNPAAIVVGWLSEVQAERLGAVEITPEHWLLGLIWQGGGAGHGVLRRLVPSVTEVRHRLLARMGVPEDVVGRYLEECERSELVAADRVREQRATHDTRWVTVAEVDERSRALLEHGGHAAVDGRDVLERLVTQAEGAGYFVVDNAGGSDSFWVVVGPRFRQVYVAAAWKGRDGLLSAVGHAVLDVLPPWLNDDEDIPRFPAVNLDT